MQPQQSISSLLQQHLSRDFCHLVIDFAQPYIVMLLHVEGRKMNRSTLKSCFGISQEIIDFGDDSSKKISNCCKEHNVKRTERNRGTKSSRISVNELASSYDPHDLVFFAIPLLSFDNFGSLVIEKEWKEEAIRMQFEGCIYNIQPKNVCTPVIRIFSLQTLKCFHTEGDLDAIDSDDECERLDWKIVHSAKTHLLQYARWKTEYQQFSEELVSIRKDFNKHSGELESIQNDIESSEKALHSLEKSCNDLHHQVLNLATFLTECQQNTKPKSVV